MKQALMIAMFYGGFRLALYVDTTIGSFSSGIMTMFFICLISTMSNPFEN